MEEPSSNDPEVGTIEENQTCFHLFNCDKTFKFDSVEKLLRDIEEKLSLKISVEKHDFNLREMSEMCNSIMSGPQMDFAIFVVHANESRLSINEENAGIGYAKIYKALLEKTGEKVIIVIGGDDNYKGPAEERSSLLSRWAHRKVSSQFDEQFRDGRKSFIFSWDKEHRPIHEEALLHYFDAEKKGKKFVPAKRVTVEPEENQVDPKKAVKSQESFEMDVEAETKKLSPQTPYDDGQTPQTGEEKEDVPMQYPQPEKEEPESLEVVSPEQQGEEQKNPLKNRGTEEQGTEEDMDTSEEYVDLVPKIAILYRDKSDIAVIRDIFGEVFTTSIAPVTSSDPSSFNDLLSSQSVRSCFIIMEAGNVKEELHKKSPSTPYQDLLKTARRTVEKKIVTLLCDDRNKISRDEENNITARIEDLLDDKGMIFLVQRKKKIPSNQTFIIY